MSIRIWYKWYQSLLDELNGCVEMGIRVLFFGENRDSGLDSPSGPGGPEATRAAPPPSGRAGSGRAYLAARRSHYAGQERTGGREKRVIERCRQAWAGLFRKFRAEYPSRADFGSSLGRLFLSLYFLTPRDSVEPFRRAFRQIGTIPSTKLLLSGPWPPYNFVLPKDPSESPFAEEAG